MKYQWIIENEDTTRLKRFMESMQQSSLVQCRKALNVDGEGKDYSRNSFWQALIMGLLTSQQRSGPDSTVYKFLRLNPFPLELSKCEQTENVEQFAQSAFQMYKGIRRIPTICKQIAKNFEWLKKDGWKQIDDFGRKLRENRKHAPENSQKILERETARVTQNLIGIGPKQSRNIWQEMGYFRYEIPLDSRVINWLNEQKFPFKLNALALSDEAFYCVVLDGIQEWCQATGILPCILDAAVFGRQENWDFTVQNKSDKRD